MGASELRTELIKLLGSIENEQLLRTVYDFVKQGEVSGEGEIWKTLTDKQKQEVYESYRESEDDANLKNWDDIKNKY
jgi:hypothetical protein